MADTKVINAKDAAIIALIDQTLAEISCRQLMDTNEATNVLLDVRQLATA